MQRILEIEALMMKNENMNALLEVAMNAVAKGAREYITRNNLVADPATLAECMKAMTKFYLPNALADAKDALACNMVQIAEATFIATMMQAGIDAAKECATPRRLAQP